MSLCMMAGIIGSIYAFGELTVGTGCLNKLSFAPGKLEQWSYGIGYYNTATQAAITSAYDGDKANLALAAGEVPNLVDCLQIAYHFLETACGEQGRYFTALQRFSASEFWLAIGALAAFCSATSSAMPRRPSPPSSPMAPPPRTSPKKGRALLRSL